MKYYYKILITNITFTFFMFGTSYIMGQDQCKPVGWATQNGGVTGGGNAVAVTCSTYTDLKNALTSASVKVVYVQGTITFPLNGRITIQNQNDKTIFGLPGSKMQSVDLTASGSGIFYIKGCTNFMMRNLVFEGPGAYDVDGNDNLTLDNCQNFWVDHCEFHDGMDGNFDLKNMSDFITATWCTFSYEKAPIPGGSGGTNDHRFSDLIGSSDAATQDDGKLRITFQYCWWGQGCVERMPRVRFGKLHIANNYFSSTVSNSCIRAGYKADLLIEGNVFEGVNKPIDLYNNDFTAVTARNNTFTGTSGNTVGSGTSFAPPYTLSMASLGTLKSLITNASCGSGATLDSPSQCGCTTTASNLSPTVSLTSPANNTYFCAGTNLTISANAADTDGTIASVKYFRGSTLIGTDTSIPYSLSWTHSIPGTYILYAVATDNAGATATSSGISITINPTTTPNVFITSSATTVCAGAGITMSATSTNGGTNPTFSWFKNNVQVSTGATYSYSPTNGDAVYAKLTAGGTLPACLSPTTDVSNVVNVTVNPMAIPNISIASSGTSVCNGNNISLTATSTNGGTNPTFSWFKNNAQVSTGATYSYTPTNGDAVYAKLTAGGTLPACLSPTTDVSNVVNVTVNSVVTPNATISGPMNVICSGSGATFSAVGLNTGTVAGFAWYVNNQWKGSGSTLFYSPANGDLVKAILTTNGLCLSSNSVSSNVIQPFVSAPISASVGVSASANPTCSGTGVVYTAAAINGGTAPIYTWRVNGLVKTGTSSTLSHTPSNMDIISVNISAGGTLPNCLTNTTASSLGITATVNGTMNSSISISPSSTSLCQGSSVIFTTSVNGTGSSPTYAWYVNGVKQLASSTNFNYVPSNGDLVRATMAPGGNGTTCILGGTASSSGISLTVLAPQTPSIAVSSSAPSLCSGTIATFTATSLNGGTSPTYNWQVNGQGQSSGNTFSYIPITGDQVSAKLTAGGTLPTCLVTKTATSTLITLTVNPLKSPSISIASSAATICSNIGVTFTATGTNGGSTPTIDWFKNGVLVNAGTLYNYIPSNGDQVFARLMVGGIFPSCLSVTTAVSNIIGLSIKACLAPQVSSISGPAIVLNGTSNISYSVPNVTGNSYQWTVPNGVTILSGQGTNSIVVNYGNFVTGSIFLNQTNTNGSTQVQLGVRSGLPPTKPVIVGNKSILPYESGAVYSITTTAGNTYQWSLPSEATISSGLGKGKIIVNFGANFNDTIHVIETNAFGSAKGFIFITTSLPTYLSNSMVNLGIQTYPNPFTNEINIIIDAWEETKPTLSISDIEGHLFEKEVEVPIKGSMSIGSDLPSGVYILTIKSGTKVAHSKITKL